MNNDVKASIIIQRKQSCTLSRIPSVNRRNVIGLVMKLGLGKCKLCVQAPVPHEITTKAALALLQVCKRNITF